ncbi:uncharacterized protein LOC131675345 [Phymastichus coffea]|uniref:uncharacterized protein LOC131675345 n=1 Tax=Phymastichus coffea TaxID=108790 RepID=UPI00273C32B7|nr:uncharacterized protein LOC131675345 [Phymastichus coffea]
MSEERVENLFSLDDASWQDALNEAIEALGEDIDLSEDEVFGLIGLPVQEAAVDEVVVEQPRTPSPRRRNDDDDIHEAATIRMPLTPPPSIFTHRTAPLQLPPPSPCSRSSSTVNVSDDDDDDVEMVCEVIVSRRPPPPPPSRRVTCVDLVTPRGAPVMMIDITTPQQPLLVNLVSPPAIQETSCRQREQVGDHNNTMPVCGGWECAHCVAGRCSRQPQWVESPPQRGSRRHVDRNGPVRQVVRRLFASRSSSPEDSPAVRQPSRSPSPAPLSRQLSRSPAELSTTALMQILEMFNLPKIFSNINVLKGSEIICSPYKHSTKFIGHRLIAVLTNALS